MATVRERLRSDGTTSYLVLYRFGGRGSKQGVLTFDDRKSADAFVASIDAHGAQRALEMHGVDPAPRKRATKTELMVAGWVRHHIDHLTGIEQSSIDKYEDYLRNDVEPFFGAMPLAALGEEDLSR
ncbi:hypothetical protein [Mycolicibacterium peregrinum]|uniref:hypothetical protein n=1 Tax=Mycolicibacterium peregrinum TaxID=43304 RepID=UPI000A930A2B|nr:hypothetical protein [Mycolicibacterium peregrinum]